MIICLLALGCDGGAPTDAGADASAPPADAGMDASSPDDAGPPDAGPTDAGPPDAGPTDAGPPTPMDTADVVEVELDATIVMRDAIPMEMRIENVVAFLETDLAAAGINAVIGEKGLGTLSLSDGAVRAFADLRQCRVVLAVLDRAIDGFAERPDPAIMALRDQLLLLRGSLIEHRDALARLFVERRDLGIPGAPVVIEPHYANALAYGTGSPARLAFAAEGQTTDAGAPSASVTVECFQGSPVLDVRVFDMVSDAELASHTSGGSSATLAVPLPLDETSILEVIVSGIDRDPMMYLDCNVSVRSRRRLRTTPVNPFDSSAYALAREDLMNQQFQVANEVLSLRSGGTFDTGVLLAVDAHVGVMSDLLVSLLPSDTSDVPVELIERVRREATYVRAMTDALVTNLQAMDSGSPGETAALRAGLTGMSDAIDALLAALP